MALTGADDQTTLQQSPLFYLFYSIYVVLKATKCSITIMIYVSLDFS